MKRYGTAAVVALALMGCDAANTSDTSSATVDTIPAPAPTPTASAPVNTADHSNFRSFFVDFREAVLNNDREAVAAMTKLPFVDYRYGDYCEPNAEDCDQPAETLSSINKAVFLAKYDRIFTPAVIAAIRENKVREGFPDDENVPPSIRTGEYFLDLEDVTQQRVFTLEAGVYKLSRVPFYS